MQDGEQAEWQQPAGRMNQKARSLVYSSLEYEQTHQNYYLSPRTKRAETNTMRILNGKRSGDRWDRSRDPLNFLTIRPQSGLALVETMQRPHPPLHMSYEKGTLILICEKCGVVSKF